MRIEINVFVTVEFFVLHSSAILIFNFSIHKHLLPAGELFKAFSLYHEI